MTNSFGEGVKPILTSISQVSPQFLSELKLMLEQDPPNIPVAAIQGLVTAEVGGLVNADGSVAGGTGFAVAVTSTGVYAVTFNTGRTFAAAPRIHVTIASDVTADAPVVSAETGAGFTVKTRAAGSLSDQAFIFTARPTE